MRKRDAHEQDSPAPTARRTAATPAAAPLNCAPPGVKPMLCYSPQAYEVAYAVAPLLSCGIDGSGETVVMPALAETGPSYSAGPYVVPHRLSGCHR
jgi:hypothetical protein